MTEARRLSKEECRVLDVLMSDSPLGGRTHDDIAATLGLKPHVALRVLDGLYSRTPPLVQSHIGEAERTWSTTGHAADAVEDGC